MSNLTLLKAYLIFWFTAKRKKGHGVHSPFIFDLITKVFYKKNSPKQFSNIEYIRKTLLNSNDSIKVSDYGAGARINQSNIRQISSIAKNSLKPKKQAQLLYRLLVYREAKVILEIGTSLGITTSYMGIANPTSQVTSLEGCPNIANIAIATHQHLQLKNVKVIIGEFKNTLPIVLNKSQSLDFIFFDGNHTKDATLSYFNQCIEHTHNETIFVFDDIYLSNSMQEAWTEIINHKKVKASLDIFHMGFVFFRKEMTKEHFKLRF